MRHISSFIVAGFVAASHLHAQETELSASLGAATSATFDYIKEHNFPFYKDEVEVRAAIESDELVQLDDLDNYTVISNTGPLYVHPTVSTFISRLGQQFLAEGCPSLIVTKGVDTTRPPLKTDRRTHHASGLVIDIVPVTLTNDVCQQWLETVLLRIESGGRIDFSIEKSDIYGKEYYGHHINVYVIEYQAWLDANT